MKKIIDYRAPRCSACKACMPLLESFCSQNGIELVKINVDEEDNNNLPDDLRSIPRIDYYNGLEKKTYVGTFNEDDLIKFTSL